jgi:hypothetical protein
MPRQERAQPRRTITAANKTQQLPSCRSVCLRDFVVCSFFCLFFCCCCVYASFLLCCSEIGSSSSSVVLVKNLKRTPWRVGGTVCSGVYAFTNAMGALHLLLSPPHPVCARHVSLHCWWCEGLSAFCKEVSGTTNDRSDHRRG